MKRFFLIFSQKRYRLHKNIVQQHFLHKDIISRGYPTKMKNYGSSKGWGGGYNKQPMEWKFEGGGFLELHIKKTLSNHLKNSLGFTSVFKPCLYKHDCER